jgi:hypothetical protein
LKVQVEQSWSMWVDKLLDLLEGVGLASIVLCGFVRQHDETFMIVHSSKSAKVKCRFVAGIKLRKTNEQRVKRRTQANVSAMLTTL